MAARQGDTHEVSNGRLLARLVATLLALWLAAIGGALIWPRSHIAAALPPMHLGALEPQRPLLGLLAFALAALVVTVSLLRPRRQDDPEARVVTPPAWRGQEERPSRPVTETAETAPTELIDAAVPTEPAAAEAALAMEAVAVPVEAEPDEPAVVAPETHAVETETAAVHPLLAIFDPEAEVAPILEAIPAVLTSPSNESRRAKLRLLAEQVAALAASLAALAGETPHEEPEPEPEEPAEPEAIRDARAELVNAPGSASRAALAYTLAEQARHALDQGDARAAATWLEEALELRRHLAMVSVGQDARLALADTAAQLAQAHIAAGEPDKAKALLQWSLDDLKPLVATSTRYADMVYAARTKLIELDRAEQPADEPPHEPAEMDPIL